MSNNQMLCFYLCGFSDFEVSAFNQELEELSLLGIQLFEAPDV